MEKRSFRSLRRMAAIAAISVGLSACASTQNDDGSVSVNDPLEPANRVVFAFNGALDAVLLRPVSYWYRDIAPEGVKRSAGNFVDNLQSPITFLNDLAQAEGERAFITAQRFLINSTVGIAGLFDVASEMGVAPFRQEDAGQTLGVWGVPDGPYLVLPIFGPSSFRDAAGTAIDMFADPVRWVPRAMDAKDIGNGLAYARTGVGAVNGRAATLETLDEIERTSLDYYAAIRSLYRQQRFDAINNGEVNSVSDGFDDNSGNPEDASFDFDEPTESAATE